MIKRDLFTIGANFWLQKSYDLKFLEQNFYRKSPKNV